MKMALIQKETDIEEDLNPDGSWLKSFTSHLYKSKNLVFLFPFVCYPVELLYLKYHPYAK